MEDVLKQIAKFKAENPDFEVIFEIRLKPATAGVDQSEASTEVAVLEPEQPTNRGTQTSITPEVPANVDKPTYETRARPGENIMDRWKALHANDPKVPCDNCGNLFQKEDAKQKFCSIECKLEKQRADRPRKEQEPKHCVHCGKNFVPARSDTLYCSLRCTQAADRIRRGKEPVGKYAHICPHCSKEFYTTHSVQKYCSDLCAREARLAEKKQTQQNTAFVIESKPDKESECQTCHKVKPYSAFYPKSLKQCKSCYNKQVNRNRIVKTGKEPRECPNCGKLTSKLYCTDDCRKEHEKMLVTKPKGDLEPKEWEELAISTVHKLSQRPDAKPLPRR